METLMYFHCFSLLLLHQPVSSIFVEKGRNVQLDVPEYKKNKEEIDSFTSLFWKFNKTNVVKHDTRGTQVSTKYKGRVKFKHLISVQVRVEPPVLTVDSSTNGTCNVKVTCRSQNTTVTSSCNSSTCSPVEEMSSEVETSSVSLLSVYMTEGTIICNHSNQVSWSNHTKKMESICVPELNGKPDPSTLGKSLTVILVPIILGILLIVCIIIYFYRRNHNKSRKGDIVNTDYATVEGPFNGGAGGGQVILSSGPESPTIYSMVQPVNSPIMQRDPHVSMGRPLTHKPPESIYAVVERNPGKK
ncbi:hypothetical protein DPEC_G00059190 [Dallia pectoralis]|uniref:Uncharacterized protein n=1 Tax=Dallia pectoralis TaxID=75939 RepID=A0ACC2H764_DALPE|nr:hypothetical protein DPEC_G00059190 [Dallia pectoralis]